MNKDANNPSAPGTREEVRRQRAIAIAEKLYAQQSKLFFRYSLLIPELEKMLRWCGVGVAIKDPEFQASTREDEYQQTHSRAAMITGLTRQEVGQYVDMNRPPVPLDGGNLHRLIRVLTAWRTEPGYQDGTGRPIDLPLRGGAPSLHQLCLAHGRNAPTRVIADAIVESGNAEWIGESDSRKPGKRLRYLHPVVTAQEDTAEDAAILTQIGSDFMHSFQQAFDPRVKPQPRFREGYFNDIDAEKKDEAIEAIYEEIHQFGLRCTERLRAFRASSDRPTVRLGVGAYSFYGAPLLVENIDTQTVPSKDSKSERK